MQHSLPRSPFTPCPAILSGGKGYYWKWLGNLARRPPWTQNAVDGRDIILSINAHSESVKKRSVTCVTTVCRHCGLDTTSGRTAFTFHGVRARRFLVWVGPYVHRIPAILSRWRCPQCHKTFTDYPPFACPHKAYTVPQMAVRAGDYVGNPATSYRKGIRTANMPIFHVQPPTGKVAQLSESGDGHCPATVAHTSLFHWVTALGTCLSRQPEASVPDFAPSPRKYTCEERRSVLVLCRATCSAVLSRHRPATSASG